MAGIEQLAYGFVKGRFLTGIGDNADEDSAPNVLPMKGYVEFTATEKLLRVAGATGEPVTVFPGTFKINLDAEGYLAHNGSREVALWATDDPDADAVGWRWRAKLALLSPQAEGDPVYFGLNAPSFEFTLPSGQTVDLATVTRLDESPPKP